MSLHKAAPALMIVLALACMVGYIPQKEWKQATYWLCVAIMTYVVTY